MSTRTNRTRSAVVALAAGAMLVPTALARPIPIQGDDGVLAAELTFRPLKPTLVTTSPGAEITQALYLQALAGAATTSR